MRNTLKRITLQTMALAAFSAAASAAVPAPERELPCPDSLPAYVQFVDPRPGSQPQELSDSAFNAVAGGVIFRVNSTELNLNSPQLSDLASRVIPYANRHKMALRGIALRGAASPEGPYLNNVRLSHGRAAALNRFLTERLNLVSDSLWTSTATEPEDYARLLWIMERDNDPSTPIVRDIIASFGLGNPHAIKNALRRAEGGKLWPRLLREIYPELRSARMVIYMDNPYPRLGPLSLGLDNLMPSIELPYLPAMQPLFPRALRRVERRHVLSISSNLLYDAFYMPNYGWAPSPNIGLEFYPTKGKFTFRAAMLFPYYHRWNKNKFFQIRDYHLEVRRYFNPGMLHTGNYLAAYVNATKYGIGLSKKKGWQGEGMGGALKYGYVLPLGSDRWRMDFHVAVGVFVTRYDPYVYGNPITGEEHNNDYYYDWTGSRNDFVRRNHRLTWFGPTEIGVTLTFDLLYHKILTKGVSMRRWETVNY